MHADCLGRALLVATRAAVRHWGEWGKKSRNPCTIPAVAAPQMVRLMRAAGAVLA